MDAGTQGARRGHWTGIGTMPVLLLGLCLLVLGASASATTVALRGQWHAAESGQTLAQAPADDTGWNEFDPATLTRFVTPGEQAWVELRPREGDWPAPPWVLSVINPGVQTVTLYQSNGAVLGSAGPGWREGSMWPGHGRLAFVLDRSVAANQPLLLRFDARGVISSPLRFTAQPAAEFVRSDGNWLALASACLGVMLAMAAVALLFACRLRDMTFLHYALFVTGYATILALQSGYIAEPLGWSTLARHPLPWGRCVVAASVAAATLFFVRFADLAHYARGARWLLLGYNGLMIAIVALAFVPGSNGLARSLLNPLLIAGAPLFLGVAVLAIWRGSFYARLFLLGWTPLLLVNALTSAQLYGVTRHWLWSDEASFICGALEALVFSLALAYRTLSLRLAYEHAREQADVDPLTGLYNRRGWVRHVRDDARAVGAEGILSLLFLDLDGFKELNDRHGHQVGDEVLRQLATAIRHELRKGDVCGRYGGEEFVVSLPATDADQAVHIAERIRARLRDAASEELPLATVSVGVATRLPNETLPMLLRRADRAMYAAKRAGRDQVVLAHAEDPA